MATQKTKVKTRPWDPARYIKDDKYAADYLDVTFEDGFEDGYFKVVGKVLWDIVRYKGVDGVAKQVGMDAEAIRTGLQDNDNLNMYLFLNVMRALGLQLHASLAGAAPDASAEG